MKDAATAKPADVVIDVIVVYTSKAARNYDQDFENAAKRGERLLARLGGDLAPVLLEQFPAVIWEDQDECLEVRPEDIPLQVPLPRS